MTTTSESWLRADSPVFRPAMRSRSFAGAISLLAALTLLVDVVWVFMAGQFFLLQLPILLGCLALLFFFGTGYFLNPPAWVGSFFLALLYFAQDFTLRQGLVGNGGADLQSLVKGALAAMLLAHGLFNGLGRSTRHPILMLFLAYALFAAFSASYSSAKALGVGSGLALVAIALATSQAASASLKVLRGYWVAMYAAAVLACVLSLLLLAVLPMTARDLADPGAYRLRGITGSANSLGPILVVGLIVGLSMVRQAGSAMARRGHVLAMLLMAGALVLTNSRSSMVGLLAGLGIAAVIRRRQTILSTLLVLLGLTVTAALLWMPSIGQAVLGTIAELFSRSGRVQELTSFTGRSDIWLASIKLIQAKLWWGYGLGSVRVEIPKVFMDAYGNTAATAHNFILESLISVGLLGTSLLLAVVGMATVGLTRWVGSSGPAGAARPSMAAPWASSDVDADWSLCALRCMWMLLTHSVVERAFAGTAAPSTVVLGLCVATAAHVALQGQQARQQRLAQLRTVA